MNSISPSTIALAFVFLGSLLWVFRWMFAACPRTSSRGGRSQAPKSNGHRIIVPVLESIASMQAAELACQIGCERCAKIMLVSVVEVPMTLGLGEPVPGAVDKAKRLLCQAESIVNQHRLPVETCVMRGRRAEEAILDLARETEAETIVVGARTASWWPTSQIGRTISSLMHHAPCQVVVAKAAAQP